MQKTEGGCGSSSCGVKYKYELFSDSWFGIYECHVHKSFFDASPRELVTKEFHFKGYTWRIKLVHGRDGNLETCLCSSNECELEVHMAFTLVNQADSMQDVTWGDLRKIQSQGNCGYPSLASIDYVKEAASGFLKDDYFLVELEMRLKLPENETFHLVPEANHVVCTWKLKDLHGKSPRLMKSGEFKIGGHSWELQLHPHGRDRSVKDLSLFVRSRSQSAVRATCNLSVVNHQSSEKNRSRGFAHTFDNWLDIGGCDRLLDPRSLEDGELGFLKDGWVGLVSYISIENQRQECLGQQLMRPSPLQMPPLTEDDGNSKQPLDPRTAGTTAGPTAQSVSETVTDTEDTFSERSSQNWLENRLSALTPGSKIANRYVVGDKTITDKPYIRFARDEFAEQERVLRFHSSRESFQNALNVNKLLSAQYVCKPIDLNDSGLFSQTPCLIFERGCYSLHTWLQKESSESRQRIGLMHEVLECLKHIHEHGIVHCDITPRNIVFFPSTHSWKLFGADTGVREKEAFPTRYTSLYSAREVLLAEDTAEASILAEPSMDMWSFGVVLYEVLTGKRFYGQWATMDKTDMVRDMLQRSLDFLDIESVQGGQFRELLRKLLCFNQEERWSARTVLNQAWCTLSDNTTQKSIGYQRSGQGVFIEQRTADQGRRCLATVKHIANLKKGEEDEGSIFEVDGKRLKIIVHRSMDRNGRDWIHVVLASCHARSIRACTGLSVQLNNEKFDKDPQTTWGETVAFGVIDVKRLSVEELTRSEGFQPDDDLVIAAHISCVKLLTDDLAKNTTYRTVNLEVIRSRTIMDWLNEKNAAFGLAPSDTKLHSEVRNCSLIRSWACRSPNKRYWLCKRSEEGNISVKRCLNKAPLLESFDRVCSQSGAIPFVTLFEEEKADGESFQPVDEQSFIVFIKRFYPESKDLTYLEHLIVERSKSCQSLLEEIVDDKTNFSWSTKYDAYIEREGHEIQDISKELGELPQHEDDVGYVIIIRESQSEEENVTVASVQKALRAIHSRATEARQSNSGVTGRGDALPTGDEEHVGGRFVEDSGEGTGNGARDDSAAGLNSPQQTQPNQ